jgi:hypothetical protein
MNPFPWYPVATARLINDSMENGLRDRPLLAGQAATSPREGILRAMQRPAEIHGPVSKKNQICNNQLRAILC